MKVRLEERIGQEFGRLTIVGVDRSGGRSLYVVRCTCGRVSRAHSSHVTRGHTRSCGCIGDESRRTATRTHGMRKSAEWQIWSGMLQRCSNPKKKHFSKYGGRGISVCDRWKSFATFLADMGPRPSPEHSIDRVNNNGNYEPGNCRWATDSEQTRNTRRNVNITFNGRTQTATDWARELGVTQWAIFKRLARGWSAEKTIATPFKKVGKK